MLPVLLIIGVVLVSTLAATASGPANSRTRSTSSARRARYLSNHPQDVNSGDIARLLVEAEISANQVARTRNGAAELGYTPFTMYAWIKKFDAYTLTQIIGESISHHEALTHISDGTLPRLDTLGAFAHSHGVALHPRADREELRRWHASPRSLTTPAKGSPSLSFPTVFEPGDWSMEEGRTAARDDEPASAEVSDELNVGPGRFEDHGDGRQAA